jgi:cytochrome subunit of sulfide dehydrogenase
VADRRDAIATKMHKIISLWIAASLAILIAERGSAADNDQAAQLAAACAGCHRLDGGDKGIPSITGLSEERFIGIMQAFKSGERSGDIMRAMARSLSDEEIAILAHYLAERGKESNRP